MNNFSQYLPILPMLHMRVRQVVWLLMLSLCLASTSVSAANGGADQLSRWQQISPALVVGGLLINVALLVGWIIYAIRQRRKIRKLDLRLTEEVAQQTKLLSEALQHAELKHRQQTQIVSYISHDLRAPLATIAGYAKLMKRNLNDDNEDRLKLKTITRSVECQLGLVEFIQGYAKSELEPLDLSPKALELVDFLNEIAQYATTLGTRRHNKFHIKVTPQIPKTVYMDGFRVRQVLINLLSNATRSTRNGAIHLELTATKVERHWQLRFSISDSGIGTHPEQQDKVAQAFYQFKEGDKGVNAGLGLGLYIAHNILQKMGIELGLDNNPDLGARFGFTLNVPADAPVVDWTAPLALPLLDAADLTLSPGSDTPAPLHTQPTGYSEKMSLPSLEHRQALAHMARNGLLTELEDWHRSMSAQYPACAEFLNLIQDAITRIDLAAVEHLALNSSTPHHRSGAHP